MRIVHSLVLHFFAWNQLKSHIVIHNYWDFVNNYYLGHFQHAFEHNPKNPSTPLRNQNQVYLLIINFQYVQN